MKRIFSAILLTLACSVAHAQWVEIASTADRSDVVYVDPATLRKTGDIAKAWVLGDYKDPVVWGTTKYLSHKRQDQFNCKEELLRTIYVVFFKDKMGNGEALQTLNQPNMEWRPVMPSTLDSALFNWACKK